MATQEIIIKLIFDYDPGENKGIPANVFLFQLLNRLDYKYPIKEIEYKGRKMTVGVLNKIKNLPLKKVDSIDKKDLPIIDKGDVTPAPKFTSKRNLRK